MGVLINIDLYSIHELNKFTTPIYAIGDIQNVIQNYIYNSFICIFINAKNVKFLLGN